MTDKIEIIENFLDKLGIEFEGVERKESDLSGCLRYVITTPEVAILIGNKGETLGALSHILKKIIEKDDVQNQDEKFFIDIGDYQNKRVCDIKNKATILAERARFFKKDIEMPPMNAYERMIVHSTFTDYPDIETESQGEDGERRVVIKYKGN
jgi:spoIIIJ-associated protein